MSKVSVPAATGRAAGAPRAAGQAAVGEGRSGLPVARSPYDSPERSEGEDPKEIPA